MLKKRETAHPAPPFISLGSAAPNQALGRGGKTAASFVECRDFLIPAGVFLASNKRRPFLKVIWGAVVGGGCKSQLQPGLTMLDVLGSMLKPKRGEKPILDLLPYRIADPGQLLVLEKRIAASIAKNYTESTSPFFAHIYF